MIRSRLAVLCSVLGVAAFSMGATPPPNPAGGTTPPPIAAPVPETQPKRGIHPIHPPPPIRSPETTEEFGKAGGGVDSQVPTREISPEERDAYVKNARERLNHWNQRIDQLKARESSLEKATKVTELEHRAANIRSDLEEIQRAAPPNFSPLRVKTEADFRALSSGFAAVTAE